MHPFGGLPENLAAFCDTLRRIHGFRIGPRELQDAARALDVVGIDDERIVRNTLRPALSGTADDVAVFDAAFTRFFFPGPAGVRQDRLSSASRERRREPSVDAERKRPSDAAPPAADTVDALDAKSGRAMPTVSDDDEQREAASLARSRYSPLDVDTDAGLELPRVDHAWRDGARSFVRRLHLGLARRWRPARRGRRFDLRRTLRAGLQTGGETMSARWLHRPRRAPRFVVVVDGSRSMSDHTSAALTIAVAIASATTRLEVFTFSTGLRRITDDVRRAAMGERRRVERLQRAWAGGTSIGACLRDLLLRFGDRAVGRTTIVLIASDGLDVGAPDLLRAAMRDLRRRSAAVVWLNPLLDSDGYEPTASGMRVARPFVSVFTNVTDAAGLARLSRAVHAR
jgi:uncharacterized protein